jgi:hypothetical protein
MFNDSDFKMVGHTLGINTYNAELSNRKKDKSLPDEFYRNYYCCCSEKDSDWEKLVVDGFAHTWNQFSNIYYGVTEKGIQIFREQFKKFVTDKFVPPSKAKQNYQEYWDSEYSNSFSDFLGIQLPEEQSRKVALFSSDYEYRYKSRKYSNVLGDWHKYKKYAKISYKKTLKEYKAKMGLR